MSSKDPVADWYNQNALLEDSRLKLGRLEYAVTMHYIKEAVTNTSTAGQATCIVDIGGGTGVYAVPLLRAGHEVSICDISSGEIELAKQKAENIDAKFAAAEAFDAKEIRGHPTFYKKNYHDVVLLLGPLYHILDEAERGDVLLAALEMARPGGFVLAAFVTRNAHLRDVAARDPERLLKESAFYSQYLKDGKYTRGSNAPMQHASIEEIRRLLASALASAKENGMEAELSKLVSCEGFLGFQHGAHLAGLDDEAFAAWEQVVLNSAEDETTLGAADHVLAVIKRSS